MTAFTRMRDRETRICGTLGGLPGDGNAVQVLARLARRRLPSGARAYLEGGGEDEYTLRRNRRAFDELELIPRVLEDVSWIETSTSVLGSRVPLPLVLSPVGAPRMFHHEG